MSGFQVQIPLRWVDLDAQQHVNNALVADYLQEARVAFIAGGPNHQLLGNGCVIASHQVEFLRPMLFDADPVTMDLVVGPVGQAQVTLGYEARQFGELTARARSVLGIVNPKTGNPRRMTTQERTWFEQQSVELEDFRDLGEWQVGESAYVADCQVRWSDLDPNGHVNNVRVFDMIAEARIRMNPDNELNMRPHDTAAGKLLWIVARQDMRYLAPIYYRLEPYQIRTAIAKVGRTSMTLVAQIEDPVDGKVLVRSKTVAVSCDEHGHPIDLPVSMATAIKRWPAVSVTGDK